MTTSKPKTTFENVAINQEFFDCLSGELFIKRSNDSAEYSTVGGDAWIGEMAQFAEDDEVELA
jgi:hypothetical protein